MIKEIGRLKIIRWFIGGDLQYPCSLTTENKKKWFYVLGFANISLGVNIYENIESYLDGEQPFACYECKYKNIIKQVVWAKVLHDLD